MSVFDFNNGLFTPRMFPQLQRVVGYCISVYLNHWCNNTFIYE